VHVKYEGEGDRVIIGANGSLLRKFQKYRAFQNHLHNGIPNFAVWGVLDKMFTLKGEQTIHRARC
jgi:hypothetical protein